MKIYVVNALVTDVPKEDMMAALVGVGRDWDDVRLIIAQDMAEADEDLDVADLSNMVDDELEKPKLNGHSIYESDVNSTEYYIYLLEV